MRLNFTFANCEHCGAEFTVSRADANRGQGKYCSRDCYFKSRVGIVRSDRGRSTEKRNCIICNAEFLVGGRGHARKAAQFCGWKCSRQARFRHGCTATQLKDVDAAHLAGLIEGEGSIMLYMRRDVVAMLITITNTNFDLLRRIESVTSVGAIHSRQRDNKNHKIAGWWRASSGAAESVLKQVRPFMWMKTAQADLALETIERLRDPKLKADRSWHLEYCERMRRLNKRGTYKVEWKQSELSLASSED